MNSYFFPLGLILAFLTAWFIPGPGAILSHYGVIPWMVFLVFLINGYQIHLLEFPHHRKIIATAFCAVLINLIISPFLGMVTSAVFGLSVGTALGLIVMSTVPTTLSSGVVMTHIAGGHVQTALLLTVLLNVLGVFTVPFILSLILENAGIISLSPWPVLRQLILIILVPFFVGIVAKRIMQKPAKRWLTKYVPSTCVIVLVWMLMSSSIEPLKELDLLSVALMLISVLVVLSVLILLCHLSKYVCRMGNQDYIALLFTASGKTLPVAVGVLTVLDQPVGLALVICIIFHFLQLFIFSIIASHIGATKRNGERCH